MADSLMIPKFIQPQSRTWTREAIEVVTNWNGADFIDRQASTHISGAIIIIFALGSIIPGPQSLYPSIIRGSYIGVSVISVTTSSILVTRYLLVSQACGDVERLVQDLVLLYESQLASDSFSFSFSCSKSAIIFGKYKASSQGFKDAVARKLLENPEAAFALSSALIPLEDRSPYLASALCRVRGENGAKAIEKCCATKVFQYEVALDAVRRVLSTDEQQPNDTAIIAVVLLLKKMRETTGTLRCGNEITALLHRWGIKHSKSIASGVVIEGAKDTGIDPSYYEEIGVIDVEGKPLSYEAFKNEWERYIPTVKQGAESATPLMTAWSHLGLDQKLLKGQKGLRERELEEKYLKEFQELFFDHCPTYPKNSNLRAIREQLFEGIGAAVETTDREFFLSDRGSSSGHISSVVQSMAGVLLLPGVSLRSDQLKTLAEVSMRSSLLDPVKILEKLEEGISSGEILEELEQEGGQHPIYLFLHSIATVYPTTFINKKGGPSKVIRKLIADILVESGCIEHPEENGTVSQKDNLSDYSSYELLVQALSYRARSPHDPLSLENCVEIFCECYNSDIVREKRKWKGVISPYLLTFLIGDDFERFMSIDKKVILRVIQHLVPQLDPQTVDTNPEESCS